MLYQIIYKVELVNNIIFYTKFKNEIVDTINEIFKNYTFFINITCQTIKDYINKSEKDDKYTINMKKHKRNNLCVIKKITKIPYKLFMINDFKKKNGNKLPKIKKYIDADYNKIYNELYNKKCYNLKKEKYKKYDVNLCV
jgi:hypothetical protein